jgi:predicted CopG family antitoxin
MFSTIQIKKETEDKLKHFGQRGESYNDIIERLMNYFDDLDVEELIKDRWKRLQKEKGKYIPLDEV